MWRRSRDARKKDLSDAKCIRGAKSRPYIMKISDVIQDNTDWKFIDRLELIYRNSAEFFQFQFSHFRYPLSVIRYPLSVIRYPLSVIRYPRGWRGKNKGGD